MSVLAHGGIPGLIAELSVAWVVGGVLAVVWFRERRRRARGEQSSRAQMRD